MQKLQVKNKIIELEFMEKNTEEYKESYLSQHICNILKYQQGTSLIENRPTKKQ
jgi:hypothetical protein